MQILAKMLPNNRLAPLPRGLAPLLEILDPQLSHFAVVNNVGMSFRAVVSNFQNDTLPKEFKGGELVSL